MRVEVVGIIDDWNVEMKNLPRQLTVFLPCASLENFSIRRSTSEAEEIFAGWAAAFHPTFLTTFDLLPTWNSADYPPNLKNPGIAYLPPSAEHAIPTQWQNQQADPDAPFQIVRGVSERREIARRIAALAEVELPVETPPSLTAFEALGIGFFLVELLGRQYRYMSSINTDRLRAAVQSAATASLNGELDELENQLQNAFDRLLEARETFFPSGVHFIDLLLTDPKHVGRAFREEMERMEREMTLAKQADHRDTVNRPNAEWTMEPEAAEVLLTPASESGSSENQSTDESTSVDGTDVNTINTITNTAGTATDKTTDAADTSGQVNAVDEAVVGDTTGDSEEAVLRLPTPQNLWITGRTLERLAETDSTTVETIRRLVVCKELAVIGGLYEELETPLLAPEDIVTNLAKGLVTAERILGKRPEVFGSRRFGLTATLPQILKQFGFMGAMHMAFDEGGYPDYRQSRMRWRGVGMGAVESLCTLPSTPRESERWLRIPEMIGTPYGPDSTPTFAVARWANQSGWLPDIFRTISRYAPVFGEYRTLTSYFTKTFSSSRLKQYDATHYRSPYLLQMIEAEEPDPISRWVRYHRRRALVTAIRSLESLYRTLAAVVKPIAQVTDFHHVKENMTHVTMPSKDQPIYESSGKTVNGSADGVVNGNESIHQNELSIHAMVKKAQLNRLPSTTCRELELIATELDSLSATLPPMPGVYQTAEQTTVTRQTETAQFEQMRRLLAKMLTLIAQKLTNSTTNTATVSSESSAKILADVTAVPTSNAESDSATEFFESRGILCINPWNRATYRAYEMEPAKKNFPRIQNVPVDGWGFRWFPTTERASNALLDTEPKSDGTTMEAVSKVSETSKISSNTFFAESATSKTAKMSAPVQLQYDESGKLYTLQNGWMQVTLDRTTGTIRSIQNHGFRRNRLALQWAMHQYNEAIGLNSQDTPGCAKEYSLCAADSVTVEEQTAECVVLRVRGRLVHRNGTQLADYMMTLRLRRGSQLLECELSLNPHVLPEGSERNPWKSAYVLRLAWADETATVSYSANLFHVESPTCSAGSVRSIESPYFVNVQNLNTQYTLLCGGLPFHRRYGPRRLDTLLITAGETERSFRFAIGVDLVQPAPAAIDFLTASESFAVYGQLSPAMTDAWWYHLDAKNLIVTLFEPIYVDSEDQTIPETWGGLRPDLSGASGKAMGGAEYFTGNADGTVERNVVGVRMRIMETEGHEVRTTLTTYRRVAEAMATDFLGENRRTLSVDGDEVTIDFDPHQWRQVEIRWTK